MGKKEAVSSKRALEGITGQEGPLLREVESLRGRLGRGLREVVLERFYQEAERISRLTVHRRAPGDGNWERRLDDCLAHPALGFPLMLMVLGVVFWITLAGANYPSQLLALSFDWLIARFSAFLLWAGAPELLRGLLADGLLRGLAAVVSVMLPPMAIFFPCFTLLEDLGYLPRVAFSLDRVMRAAGAQGKTALTLAMGFGCNAAGVMASRVIESPRERMLAILTNTFVPCNGRYPTILAISALFFASLAAPMVVGFVVLGIATALAVSFAMSRTLLRGEPSRFILEIPPWRRPAVGRVLARSLRHRILWVLWRAVKVAAPASLVIWALANLPPGLPFEQTAVGRTVAFLDPWVRPMGLDGMTAIALLFATPAKETIVPTLAVGYGLQRTLSDSQTVLGLLAGQWTPLTALSFLLFYVLYFPCGTTILTIFRETRSLKWTAFAVLMPLFVASAVSLAVYQVGSLILAIS